ncbi:MAG: HesA/MoeB/ThiF family protein [Chitinophagaceae bacterium]|nr:HesA/MoeB/ThiF family protein [Chitinophagaceae bacterium]MCB9044797.1 ThiF family adenylyltransferase [Chitinophagales bacterium]
MSDLARYSCQMALPGFDIRAQEKLSATKVLIVGAGGLGCPVAQYLVSTGVGTLAIADYDTVVVKNLHRQILYTPADEGKKKVAVAAERLQQQNPEINIIPLDLKITAENVLDIINGYDVVVDATDNFDTRYLLNDACVLSGKPLVYGAIYQYEGQVAVWNVANADGSRSPNYRDLYPDVNAAVVPNCAEGGVLPTIAGIIGCMQANEVIKYITGIGELLAGKLLFVDATTMQSRTIKLGKTTQTNITALPFSVQEISATVLQNDTTAYYLIDVRTAEERNTFHIGGVHIPLQEITNAAIETGKPIVCYCASGRRSAEAVKILSGRFPGVEIYSLQGGVEAWKVHQG